MAIQLCRLGHPLIALGVLMMVALPSTEAIAVASFLPTLAAKSSESHKLDFDVVAPGKKAHRSKTGESDERVVLDNPRIKFLEPILEALHNKSPQLHIVDMQYPAFHRLFTQASRDLGLDLVPYLARHSGASIDRATGFRSLAEVQRMGRWQAPRSVRRYEKMGRLNDTWRSLSVKQQSYFELYERSLIPAVTHGLLPLAPLF